MVKETLCKVFSPTMTKMHAVTRIHSHSQATNESSQEYIQRFADFVSQAMGTDLTAVTSHGTVVLFIRHLFYYERSDRS